MKRAGRAVRRKVGGGHAGSGLIRGRPGQAKPDALDPKQLRDVQARHLHRGRGPHLQRAFADKAKDRLAHGGDRVPYSSARPAMVGRWPGSYWPFIGARADWRKAAPRGFADKFSCISASLQACGRSGLQAPAGTPETPETPLLSGMYNRCARDAIPCRASFARAAAASAISATARLSRLAGRSKSLPSLPCLTSAPEQRGVCPGTGVSTPPPSMPAPRLIRRRARQVLIYRIHRGCLQTRPMQRGFSPVKRSDISHSRLTNPTVAAQAAYRGDGGGAGAVCCSSGHAAQIMALFPLMGPRQEHPPRPGFTAARSPSSARPSSLAGRQIRRSDDPQAVQAAIDDDTRAIFCESISNPGYPTDIPAIAAIADAGAADRRQRRRRPICTSRSRWGRRWSSTA